MAGADFGFDRLPLKSGGADSSGRQMNEADQLVAVKQHSRSPRLTTQHVLNMFLERVIVVIKRNEFVSAGMREHAQ
jgi:hypothetical protein